MENFKVITINNPIDNIKVERKEIHISLKEIAEVITICEMESQKNNPDFNIVASGWLHLLNHLPVPMYYYDISHSVIRARANVDDEIFKHIDDISYNKTKPHLCKLGRFNLEGEGIFYGAVPTSNEVSNGSVTTIVESYKELLDSKNVEISKYFTLGKWIVKKKFPLAVLTFSKDAYGKSPEVKNTNPIYTDFLNQMYSPENMKKLNIFYEFLSHAAGKKIDSQANYFLTTSFYHALRYYYGNEIGILYSSSSTENCGLNMVLSKKLIDEKFIELEFAIMFKCQRWHEDNKQFTILPCSNKSLPDLEGKLNFNVDF